MWIISKLSSSAGGPAQPPAIEKDGPPGALGNGGAKVPAKCVLVLAGPEGSEPSAYRLYCSKMSFSALDLCGKENPTSLR